MTDLRCASASSALRLLSRPGGGPQLGLDKRLARASERGASAHASWSVAAGQDRSRRRPSRRRAGWRHQQSRSRANGLKTLGIPSKQAGLALFVGQSGNRELQTAQAYACYHPFKQDNVQAA